MDLIIVFLMKTGYTMLPCKVAFCFVLMFLLHAAHAQHTELTEMKRVRISFTLDKEGTPLYEVTFNGKPVLLSSRLGFKLNEDRAFYKGFQWKGMERKSVDTVWQTVWGETRTIRDHYEQFVVHLEKGGAASTEKGAASPLRKLDIIFRVFEDGVGFRYVFPGQPDLKYFIVSDELPQFHLAGDHKTFWIPGDYDTNEYPYTTSKLSEINNKELAEKSTDIAVRVAPDEYAVQTPLMMKSNEGLYINIHEAALVNYPAMQLHVDRQNLSLSAELVPDAFGNKAYLHAPFPTPWRPILVSDKAADMLLSRTILNLNEPYRLSR